MITKFTSSYHCFSFMVFSCFPLSLLRPMHNTTQLIYINYYNLTTRTNTFVLNPLHPNNSVHRLHTLLYIEPINWYFTLLAGRVYLSVNWKLLKLANIFFIILMILMKDSVVLLRGGSTSVVLLRGGCTCWSFLVFKGLTNNN